MLEAFARHWDELQVGPEQTLTLSLSGGGDSVALFHLLRETRVPFSAIYFKHDSPGGFARECGDFCRRLCQEFKVPFQLVEVAARDFQSEGDLSWEAAARHLRYRHFASISGLVMTAHTADDQAETVLLRLFDGSALAGLAGIRERTERWLRPLLPFRRQQLREYLQQGHLEWMEDPTNQDGNDRARLRQGWLPRLEAEVPSLVDKLGRTARRLAQDEEVLSRLACQWLQEHGKSGDSWPLDELRKLEAAIRYRVLREIWRVASPPSYRPLGTLFEEVERLVISGADDRGVSFAGGTFRRLGSRLWLEPPLEEADWGSLVVSFECPMEQRFWKVDVSAQGTGDALVCDIAPPSEGSHLELRSRRPGDRYRGKDLKKVLAATGHPPWVRDRWPLLVRDGDVVDLPLQSQAGGSDENRWKLYFWPYRLRAGQKEELYRAAEKDY